MQNGNIGGIRTPKPPERIVTKFGVGDYVGDVTPTPRTPKFKPVGAANTINGSSFLGWTNMHRQQPEWPRGRISFDFPWRGASENGGPWAMA